MHISDGISYGEMYFIDRLSFTIATARSRFAPLRGSTPLRSAQDDTKGDGEIPPDGAPSGFDYAHSRSAQDDTKKRRGYRRCRVNFKYF